MQKHFKNKLFSISALALLVVAQVRADSLDRMEYKLNRLLRQFETTINGGGAPGFTDRGLGIYEDFVAREIIDKNIAPGWGTAAMAQNNPFFNNQGFRDIDFTGSGTGPNPKPMTPDTIMRIASQSKLLTAVGFLTLVDKGYAALEDDVATYIPAFANTKVIEPCSPYSFVKLGNDPFATVAGSPTVTVTHENHGMATGDFVIITRHLPQLSVNGIPSFALESVFPVTVLDPDHYQVTNFLGAPAAVTGNAGGALVNVAPLAAPGSFLLGANPVSTTISSNTVTVSQAGHTFVAGDVIGIQMSTAVGGIPASEINNVHTITSVVPGVSYSFQVSTLATATTTGGGTNVRVFTLCFGAKQIQFLGATYYWKDQELVTSLKIHNLLNHTSGHVEGTEPLGLGGIGLNPNVYGVYCGVASVIAPGGTPIPEGIPNPASPLSNNGSASLQIWAETYAQIPLLFQPGSQFAYGPQQAITGALIEKVDPLGRGLEQFMKEEIFDPIGMPDTGYFISDTDPDRADKLDRFAVMYDNSGAPSIPFIPIDSLVPASHAPIAALAGFVQYVYYSGPRQLPLGDAGMFSTFADYAKFLNVMLNNGVTPDGTVILSPAMMAALSRNQIDNLNTNPYWLLFNQDQSVNNMRWGLGVGLNQGVNVETYGASRKQIAWTSAFRTQFLADLTNHMLMQVGTNMVDFSDSQILQREMNMAESLIMNALSSVRTFDEEMYTPGIASPYNLAAYAPTA